jgi:hypothetical protein
MGSREKEMLTEERMGEIALALVKEDLRRGRAFDPSFRRELGNIAKTTGIPLEELIEFRKLLIKYLFEETFGKEEKSNEVGNDEI